MLPPGELYRLVLPWVQALGLGQGGPSQAGVAALLTALLVGQSLWPSALMRALPSPPACFARSRYQRVARAWRRPWLSSAHLTPVLVRAVGALLPVAARGPLAGLTHLALDTVRCGRWELFVLGMVWHGRVVPLAWAVLPYPLPKGQFTPTVCALLCQVAAVWPAERPVHLVADRAFASGRLLRLLRALKWGYTLRLRARLHLTVGGREQAVPELWTAAPAAQWSAQPAQYGRGAAGVSGTLVLGKGHWLVPAHQATPGSVRHRARQQARRAHDLRTKRPGRPRAAAPASDGWVVLFSTHAVGWVAALSYRQRWAIEGSFRDLQSGWDGQHGWGLERLLQHWGPASPTVERVVGLSALGSLLQCWLGEELGRPTVPAVMAAVRQEWTTTGRLSVWARGQLAVTEPTGRLQPWLRATLGRGADQLHAAGSAESGRPPAPSEPSAPAVAA
jgi:hypothetical protein